MDLMSHDIFVPGRLCIIGEHTDWAAEYLSHTSPPDSVGACTIDGVGVGQALVCSTNEGLYATCRSQYDMMITFISTDSNGVMRNFSEELVYSRLVARANDEFFGYISGTAAIVLQRCERDMFTN